MKSTPAPRSNTAALRAAFVLEILVDECNRHAALSHGGRDALDRAQPDIAARKYARYARFEEIGVPIVRPAAAFQYVIAGRDESATVARDLRWEPLRFRVGADEDEQSATVLEAGFFAVAVDDVHCHQVSVAPDGNDFRIEPIRDVGLPAQLLDQVVR